MRKTLEQTQRSGCVPHPQSFPTSWHSPGLGINRGACCAPRMHVCRVPISEYTVIGLSEGPYLTFGLQVAGHSRAHRSSASAINPLLAWFSLLNINKTLNKGRFNRRIFGSSDIKSSKAPPNVLPVDGSCLNGFWLQKSCFKVIYRYTGFSCVAQVTSFTAVECGMQVPA